MFLRVGCNLLALKPKDFSDGHLEFFLVVGLASTEGLLGLGDVLDKVIEV